VIEVLDGIVEMLEPRAERNSSINVDDAYAEPLEYKAETLYVFERSDDRRLAGTSPADINDTEARREARAIPPEDQEQPDGAARRGLR
jgi:hypothetical protein